MSPATTEHKRSKGDIRSLDCWNRTMEDTIPTNEKEIPTVDVQTSARTDDRGHYTGGTSHYHL